MSLSLTGNDQRGIGCVTCAAASCALASGSAASGAAPSTRAVPSIDDVSALPALSVDLIVATPTWLGRPSSVSQRAFDRMDAFQSETRDDRETPVALTRVAGVVVAGNEDGTQHCISEISGAPIDWLTTDERE